MHLTENTSVSQVHWNVILDKLISVPEEKRWISSELMEKKLEDRKVFGAAGKKKKKYPLTDHENTLEMTELHLF